MHLIKYENVVDTIHRRVFAGGGVMERFNQYIDILIRALLLTVLFIILLPVNILLRLTQRTDIR